MLKFTPLEFETEQQIINKARSRVKIYSVGV